MDNRFTFVVSDESVNKYGFRVLTEGIDLSEFSRNPVMYWNHRRDEDGMFGERSEGDRLPIGRWENLRNENGRLLADAVLDLDDELGAEVARKIAAGFINAASIGISIQATSDSDKLMAPGQTRPTITESILDEISIVDIPANSNAMRLSYKGDKRVTLNGTQDVEKINDMLPEQKLGANLAEQAQAAVDAYIAANEMTVEEAEAAIAEAVGVSVEALQAIKAGEACASREQLAALAEFTGAELSPMIEAALADGCWSDESAQEETEEAAEEMAAPTVAEQVTNALNGFFTKLKAAFNLVPKQDTESAQELFADLFAELNTELNVTLSAPKATTSEELAELRAEVETLKAERKQAAKMEEQIETLQAELATLSGKRSGAMPAAERQPLTDKKENTPDPMRAALSAFGSRGAYFLHKND